MCHNGGKRPVRAGPQAGKRLCQGLVALLGVCLSAIVIQAAGQEKEPGLLPIAGKPSGTSMRSVRLELHARKSLLDDDQLAGLNLGVRVREGVATLWGSVPSKVLAEQAVKKVGAVQGILDVRSELQVVKAPPPPITLPLDNDGPTVTQSAFPDREQSKLPIAGSALSPPELEKPLGQLRREEEGEVRQPPAAREAEPVVKLLPPRVWTVSSADQGATEEKKPASVAPTAQSITAAIDRIRTADPRFRSLRVEIEGAAVSVLGSAEQGSEAMELADQLSRIQGISRVVVRNPDSSIPR